MNTEKDFSPLTPNIVRALNDKLYEKRKVAALEIEKLVREFVAQNNSTQIRHVIQILASEFALSQHPHSRKGGLIGLAACSIALGKDSGLYLKELIEPVLTCFNDSDSRLRYYACEALYNIVKVARGAVLPHFNVLFDGLSKLAADPDPNVKSGSELLDRLLKDIVTESNKFDLVAFVPLLRERIYSNNQYARQFIISWILVLESVPDINLLDYLPEILDGLFQILGDSSKEIRRTCEVVLGEFLKEIKKTPSSVKFAEMANILVIHCQVSDESKLTNDLIQLTAMTWMREFIQLAGRVVLPYSSGILTAVLPCLSYDDRKKSTKEAASACNHSLMKLVTPEDDEEEEEGQVNETPTQEGSPPKTQEEISTGLLSVSICLQEETDDYLFGALKVRQSKPTSGESSPGCPSDPDCSGEDREVKYFCSTKVSQTYAAEGSTNPRMPFEEFAAFLQCELEASKYREKERKRATEEGGKKRSAELQPTGRLCRFCHLPLKLGPTSPQIHTGFPGVAGKYIYWPSRVLSLYRAQGMVAEMNWREFQQSASYEAEKQRWALEKGKFSHFCIADSLNASQDSVGFSNISFFTPTSADRTQVTLDLDGIVQVLDRHLHDSSTGMMTRIAVLKWLYHLYIKTPRKMFRHTDSLFPMLLKTLSDESDELLLLLNQWALQVILKDLEVLAEIASSPAGQTDAAGSCDNNDGKSELQVPVPAQPGDPAVGE
ncbi:hypothetical protein JZ751_020932 [Albula glossodonta]|uniref:Protein VAC14 homolog n=3 Tax=Albula glossodonta TaxID=121402 RepID=A0A8T2PNK8_9TELE|nr:hypothetical protein JZ751_020932 [Albula glossodonta]